MEGLSDEALEVTKIGQPYNWHRTKQSFDSLLKGHLYRVRMSNLPNWQYWEKKAKIANNAYIIEKNQMIIKIYTLTVKNANNLRNFFESMCPGLIFENLVFLMNWQIIFPSMTAVDDGLQKIS